MWLLEGSLKSWCDTRRAQCWFSGGENPLPQLEKEIATMNPEQQKERALGFLKNFEKPDAKAFENIITDDFEFEMMGRLPGINPVRVKDAFLNGLPTQLK